MKKILLTSENTMLSSSRPLLASLLAPLLAAAYGAPRTAAESAPRRILLIRRNGIGDMICALPLMRRLRAGLPGARIDVLASERNACILEGLPVVDRVLIYRRGTGFLRNHYFNLPRLVRPIRDEGYDVTIAAMGGFSKLVAVITYATGVPRRIGFVPAGGHALDFCFNVPIAQPSTREHQIERCLRLAQPLGTPPVPIDVTFPLRAEHEAYARECAAAHGLERGRYVLFNVSSNRPEGRWTAQAIAQAAHRLRERHGLKSLACGIPQDRALLDSLGLPSEVTPSVHHFAALTQEAFFLVCSDGGPMHVAAAMQAPVFVLFASADPHTWRPWGVPFAYVRSGTEVARLSVDAMMAKLEEWLPSVAARRETGPGPYDRGLSTTNV